jgi:hypothetical protein
MTIAAECREIKARSNRFARGRRRWNNAASATARHSSAAHLQRAASSRWPDAEVQPQEKRAARVYEFTPATPPYRIGR